MEPLTDSTPTNNDIISPDVQDMLKRQAIQQDFNDLVRSVKATKSSTNPHFKNKYAPLDAWLEEIHKWVGEFNFILSECYRVMDTANDGLVTIHSATLVHISGVTFSSEYPVGQLDKPQAMGSASTYARRYNIQCLLTCTGEDDDDGEVAQAQPTTQPTRERVPMAPRGKRLT
jgi:ERF superfamily